MVTVPAGFFRSWSGSRSSFGGALLEPPRLDPPATDVTPRIAPADVVQPRERCSRRSLESARPCQGAGGEGEAEVAKVLCVLYEDPVDGYPRSYARDAIPRIERYYDGQTTPTPERIDFEPGELLGSVSGELGLRPFLEERGHAFVVTSDKDGPDSVFERELVDAAIVISQPFWPASPDLRAGPVRWRGCPVRHTAGGGVWEGRKPGAWCRQRACGVGLPHPEPSGLVLL